MSMFRKMMGGGESSLKKYAIAVYEYDEVSGTTCVDAVGLNNGVYKGTYTLNQTGIINKSLLSTASYRIDATNNSKFTPELSPKSWNCWVKFDTIPTGLTFLSSVRSSTQVAYQWNFYLNNLEFAVGDGTTNLANYIVCRYQRASLGLTTGVWYMFTVTYNGGISIGSLKMYFNSNLLNTTNTMVGNFTGTTYNSLLKFSDGYFNPYGLIAYRDQLSVFDKELDSSEIQRLYNSGNGLPYTQF